MRIPRFNEYFGLFHAASAIPPCICRNSSSSRVTRLWLSLSCSSMACAHVSHSSTFVSNALERDRARSSSSMSSSFSHSSLRIVAVKDPLSTCGTELCNSHFAISDSPGTSAEAPQDTDVLLCSNWSFGLCSLALGSSGRRPQLSDPGCR